MNMFIVAGFMAAMFVTMCPVPGPGLMRAPSFFTVRMGMFVLVPVRMFMLVLVRVLQVPVPMLVGVYMLVLVFVVMRVFRILFHGSPSCFFFIPSLTGSAAKPGSQ
jgi:hypothetical protein